jgi:putative transposase
VWIRQRDGANLDFVVAHTDRGSQHTSIRYTERLAQAGIAASVGSVGDSYDNALAETINGLYKTELIKPRGPWRTVDAVEYATAEYIEWLNHRRLYEHCGDIPPSSWRTPTTLTREPSPPLSSHTSKSPDMPGRFRVSAGSEGVSRG